MIKVTLNRETNKLNIEFKYAPDYVRRIKKVPGARFFRTDNPYWEIPMESFPVFEEIFQGEIIYATPRSQITGEPDPDYHADITKVDIIPTAIPLYEFQKFGASFLYQRAIEGGFAFLCDTTGVGKSPQALGARLLMEQHISPLPTLIVAPAAVRHQWVADVIPKFLGNNVEVVEVEGTQQQRLKLYGTAEITVANYESLLKDVDYLKGLDFNLVILDECHKLKNRRSKTHKSIKKLLKQFKNALIFGLTATPLVNELEDLYALFEVASPGFFGKYTNFRNEYLRYDFTKSYPRLVGYKNLDKLMKKVSPYILRRTDDDPEVAKYLPKVRVQNFYINPSREQLKVHNLIYNDMLAETRKSGVDLSEEKIHGYNMLMQGVADDLRLFYMSKAPMVIKYRKNISSSSPSPKLVYLKELVNDLTPQGKVIIFTCFERMARLIADSLSDYDPALFTGKNRDTRDDELKRFWDDPSCQVLILTDAGNEGLNIQNARFMINFDFPNWSPGQLEQRYGRIKRFNSKYDSILVINLIMRDLIDERVLASLRRKKDTFIAVFGTS